MERGNERETWGFVVRFWEEIGTFLILSLKNTLKFRIKSTKLAY